MTFANGARFRDLCTDCRRTLGPSYEPFCSRCGGMADVEYDLARVELHDSPDPYVRFRELLPVVAPGFHGFGATATPMVHAVRLGEAIGVPWLYLKDETRLATGTTKDRQGLVALPYLQEHGIHDFCTSSTGNSSTALAHAIARFPAMRMFLFTGERWAPRVRVPASDQVVHFVLKDGTFEEAFDLVKMFAARRGIVSDMGFFNPGRREGLKVTWLEAVEQVPRPIDWYVQSVSSALGCYGVFGAAKNLMGMGRVDRLPRLLCVQQDSCAPMVRAWSEGAATIRPEHIVRRPTGIAHAILRGDPTRAYPFIRKIVLESRGTLTAVSEREIRAARGAIEDLEGLSPCFTASAAVAGVAKLARTGEIPRNDTIVVNLTGSDRAPLPPEVRGEHLLIRSGDDWVPADSGDDVARSWFPGSIR